MKPRCSLACAGQIVQEASEQTLGEMETIVDVMLAAALRQLDPEGPDPLAQLLVEIDRTHTQGAPD